MQAVPNSDFQQQLRTQLPTALSSALKIQPYMSCPRFHMGYMTKQGTLLSLCSGPLLQGLWSTPKSACAPHSPAHCEAGQGWVPPASKNHCCCQQGKPCLHFLISTASWEPAFYETTIIYTITQECPSRELREILNPLLKAPQQHLCMWTLCTTQA